MLYGFFFFKQKTAYEMRISDWSSDVCSSDLLERFIGMLIENHAGAMPAWLSPEHAVVCCISEASASYADEIALSLKKQGFRAHSDLQIGRASCRERVCQYV